MNIFMAEYQNRYALNQLLLRNYTAFYTTSEFTYYGSTGFADKIDLEKTDFAEKSDLREVYQVTFSRSCKAYQVT